MVRVLEKILARPVTLGMTCMAVLLGGCFGLSRIPLNLAPPVELPSLSIGARWSSASAETMERVVTAPLEDIAGTLKGFRSVRSVSREGHSSLSVEFEQEADMHRVRLELNEKLSVFSRSLPADVSRPAVQPFVPDEFQALQGFISYALVADAPPAALQRIAEDVAVPRLMAVPGVARVRVLGGADESLLVELSALHMAAYGLTPDCVTAALNGIRPGVAAGGVAWRGGRAIMTLGQSSLSLSELRDLPVAGKPGESHVRLRDVGTVRVGASGLAGYYRINGKPCVVLALDREPDSNILTVAGSVHRAVGEIQARLPSGMQLLSETDRSLRMEREFTSLWHEAAFSVFFIWAVLVPFLRNAWAPVVLVSSILFSLAGTFLVFWIFGVGVHVLTLAGLVLGFGRLVDDSIVVLENIHRHAASGDRAVAPATAEVGLPVLASTLATAGAFAPVILMPKELQMYFLDFAVAVATSLCMSFLVSLTVIPSLAAHWRFLHAGPASGPVQSAGTIRIYARLLRLALRHRVIVLSITIWLFGIPLWMLPERFDSSSWAAVLYNQTIGSAWYTKLRPAVDRLLGGASRLFFKNVAGGETPDPGEETYLQLRLEFPQGTEEERVDAAARFIEREVLAAAPRGVDVSARVAQEQALIRIDFADRAPSSPLPARMKSLCLRLAALTGGASVSLAGFGPAFAAGEEFPPAFTLKLLGYNYAQVKQLAVLLRGRLASNPRVTGVEIDRSFEFWSESSEAVACVDEEAVARYQLRPRDVIQAMHGYTGSSTGPGPFELEARRIPYIVDVKGADTMTARDLEESLMGAGPPLKGLLRIEQRPAPSEIVRENHQYVRWVSFGYKGPYRHAFLYLNELLSRFPLPEGYRIERPDMLAALAGTRRSTMVLAAIGSLFIVFLVTGALYESWRTPLVIIFSVPVVLIGVFFAFVLAGVPFTIGGYGSVMLLTGIAASNGIVIVDFISRRVAERGRSDEVIVEAAACRLRPVLMTTLATAGSMIPLLLGSRTGIWFALALGTLGGLGASLVLTLFVVPVLYAAMQKRHEK